MKSKNKNRNHKMKLIILILSMLCIMALLVILLLARGRSLGSENSPADESGTETLVQEEEAEKAEAEAEAAALAAREKAASHIYSYRGTSGDDEFTIDAYDRAVYAGSRFLEADMIVSASGTIYIAHDDYAQDMTGISGYFSGMADSQIDQLRTRNGNSILKLSELFDKYGDSVTYIINIRYISSRNISAFTDIVNSYGLSGNVIAASSYLDALRPLENTFPDMTKIYLCSEQANFNGALGMSYVDEVSAEKSLMTESNIDAARSAGKRFSAWVLESEEDIRRAIELGADAYFTGDTALAAELEAEYRQE